MKLMRERQPMQSPEGATSRDPPEQSAVMDKENRIYAFWLLGAAGFGLAVFGVIYGFHCHLAAWHLDKAQTAIWETIVKAVAGYVAVIGAVITAFKYIDEKTRQKLLDLNAEKRQWELDRREERKQFILQREAVYRRLGLALAAIMYNDPPDEWNPAKKKFYEIYWGELPLFADDTVLELVEPFSDDIDRIQKKEEKSTLVNQVVAITGACRKSLEKDRDNLKEEDRKATHEREYRHL